MLYVMKQQYCHYGFLVYTRRACEAARLAGIAKDIEALPVEMNTLISGGGGMIVLDKRHIAEEGTYEELKKKVYLLLK